MASAIRRFIGTSPFLPPDPAVIRMIIPDTAPKISNDKKSLNSRHILPPSFLFRRKEAKENHLRSSHSLRSSRFRQPATQNGRFTYEPSVFRSGQDMRESVFPRKRASPAVSFVSFLQEKKTYPFKKRNRPPLEEKKSFPQRTPSYLPKMRSSSDGGSVAFGTKAGAAVASDGAAVGVGAASAGPP